MIVEKGYAKINLGLEVLNRRSDNYHNLQMIMTTIDLYDELYFEDNIDGTCQIVYDRPVFHNNETDLIYKAYMLLKDTYGINKGIKVRVVKRIPIQAGLGGGSADAAATLRGLNTLWNLNLRLDELAELGFLLGSDIPFCIYNKTSRVSGRGEIVEFISECPFMHLVLVLPVKGASTSEVFNAYTVQTRKQMQLPKLEKAIIEGNITTIASALFNDLEDVRHISWVKDIKESMIHAGAIGASMSGSGTTVYGICYSLKHAASVKDKFVGTNKGYKKDYDILVTAVRSFRKPRTKQKEMQVKTRMVITDSCETKAYAMLPLFYKRMMEHEQIVLSPLSLYDNIRIQKTDGANVDVYINGISEVSELSRYVKKISEYIGCGLIVNIKRNTPLNAELITAENYLAAILSALADFGYDSEKLFLCFDNCVRAYRNYNTVLYNSKNEQITKIDDAVFCYVVLVPLDIKNYQSPRYTYQIDGDTLKLEAFLAGIKEKNFYGMANCIYNGVANFDVRKINHMKGYNYYGRLEDACINARAKGFMLAVGGKYAFALYRVEKNAKKLESIIKSRFKVSGIVTSLKSLSSHQPYKNLYLKTEKDSGMVYDEFDYCDESSPFENDYEQNIPNSYEQGRVRGIRKRQKRSKENEPTSAGDFEGILYLHSGGSLFKQYDFIDIANYFRKYFHDKYLNFIIDGEKIRVRFDVSYLSHIMGMHKIDVSFSGMVGFQKLIRGDISYKKLKRVNQGTVGVLKEIAERTQSSILIFNDIINNRLDNISCFGRNIILRNDSKNEKFEYGITRMLTSTTFHRQNLLGIGKDPNTKERFFITSYLWKVPASIGKKDSLPISIIR